MKSSDVIESLSLEPLEVEGGFFNEVYRSADLIQHNGRERSLGTSIYYLLEGKGMSDWHKVASDEIWYYHAGSPAVQLLLYPDGSYDKVVIGPDFHKGQRPQSIIPAGTWQAAVLVDRQESSWGLFGAAVFPGFEYSDFELGKGDQLSLQFPEAASLISELGLL